MRVNFDRAMAWIKPIEGWKGGAPNDPGKETICGISIIEHPSDVALMRSMTEDQAWEHAAQIYLNDYWIHAGCDELPWPQDIVRFDSAVQSYKGFFHDWQETAPDMYHFLLRRLMYYQTVVNGRWKDRGGWINRIIDLARLIEKGE